jgi:hypothetical protein
MSGSLWTMSRLAEAQSFSLLAEVAIVYSWG